MLNIARKSSHFAKDSDQLQQHIHAIYPTTMNAQRQCMTLLVLSVLNPFPPRERYLYAKTMAMRSMLLILTIIVHAADGFIYPICAYLPVSSSSRLQPLHLVDDNRESIAVTINTTMSERNTRKLFAWIKCALDNNDDDKNDVYAYYYNNIELAIAAAFGNNIPVDSLPAKLLDMALKKEGLSDDQNEEGDREWEERLLGESIGRRDRESASLGAMGAAQWSGRWMTRPHSLLNVQNFTTVDDWIQTLPRGCKRTLKKATPEEQNFTVTGKPIRGGHRAPHSSYAHFRCVVQHEVRLISNMYGSSTNAFVNALAEGISRYQGTTRMAGNVLEYRDTITGKIIGFAHEVTKGRTMRGQWFYCDDDAATRYVWFHSVSDLVRRAIDDPRIDVVDLGPSGSDAFTELKEKYGFIPITDWPAAADYSGDFIYEDSQNEVETMGDEMIKMIEALMKGKREVDD